MARGIFSGIILGGAVTAVGLVTASQYTERVVLTPSGSEPEATAVEVPPGSEFNRERPESEPVLPQSEGRPDGTAPPPVPDVDSGALAPPSPDTQPAAVPDAGAVGESGLDAPDTGTAPEVTASAEEAVLPPPGALQPPEPAADVAPIAEADETPADTSVEAGTTPEDPPEATPDAPLAAEPDVNVGLRLPVPEIGDMAPGVTTDRLPSIGAQPMAEAAEPALEAHAVPFKATGAGPLMALILRDPGPGRPDPSALADFPVPVTVAIDPTASGAAEAMAAYRAAGLEVVVLTPLAEGATPADVEVAFQGFLSAVSEAVAVLDLPEALLQESRPRAAQVAEILAASGHGMITYDKGLNSALQVAEGAGVKAKTVFRAFDDGTGDAEAMKRVLDQGAFRAGQEEGVLMVGELRPETVSALAEWALGTRAETISLAPVSAVLSRQ